jgi:hypothetical protein
MKKKEKIMASILTISEELGKQEEMLRQEILADLGALVVSAVVKNDLGQLDFSPEKKEKILRLADNLKDVI